MNDVEISLIFAMFVGLVCLFAMWVEQNNRRWW